MKALRKFAAFCGGVSLSLLVVPAVYAAGTYDTLTAAVNWSEVTTAIVAIGALLAAVLVVSRGTRMILRMIGR